ncbi:MAG: DUF192 domain-containing protein [Candidatus Peregrinibacteria bacterium]|nr:DUF192 domain-containing protein [Candidatus Peregrinibacteria bacterium]
MIFLMFIFVFELFFGGMTPHELLLDMQASVARSQEVVQDSFVRFPGVQFDVEVARTAAQRTRGLMFRESMPVNRGMIFVFDDDAVRNFWMKNTLIPLDMIFVDKDGQVVSVSANVQPCREKVSSACPNYASTEPARYVLEINAGLAHSHHIQKGSRMDISIS